MCQMAGFTCHLSHVTCHLSPVTWPHSIQLEQLWKSQDVRWCGRGRFGDWSSITKLFCLKTTQKKLVVVLSSYLRNFRKSPSLSVLELLGEGGGGKPCQVYNTVHCTVQVDKLTPLRRNNRAQPSAQTCCFIVPPLWGWTWSFGAILDPLSI